MSRVELDGAGRDGVVLVFRRRPTRNDDAHASLPALNRDHQVLLRFLACLDAHAGATAGYDACQRLRTVLRIAQPSVVDTLSRCVEDPTDAMEAMERLRCALERPGCTTSRYGAQAYGVGTLVAATSTAIKHVLRHTLHATGEVP